MAGSAGIENSYLVQGLKTNEMRLFLKCFREESYSAGSYIFKENDEGDTLYVAESGTVSMRQWIMPGGVEKTILTAERGGVFGEISFMDRRGRSASALVEEDAVVHVLSRSDFEEFTREYPGAGLKVLDSLLCIVVVRLRVTNEAYREALQQGLHVIGFLLFQFGPARFKLSNIFQRGRGCFAFRQQEIPAVASLNLYQITDVPQVLYFLKQDDFHRLFSPPDCPDRFTN